MDGVVEFVAVGGAAGGAMEPRDSAVAVPGQGLEGDRYANGTGFFSDTPGDGRDLTLCEVETLDALLAQHRIRLGPIEHRRNLTTRGINLNELVGKRFLVGKVLCEGVRLCEPCEHLVELAGKDVLAPLVHRAGLRANLLSGGVIHVGDTIAEVEAAGVTPVERVGS
jgi:MOSC domain-containing protein YiiM